MGIHIDLNTRFDGRALIEAQKTLNGMVSTALNTGNAMKMASVASSALKGDFAGAAKTALNLAASLKIVSAAATAGAGIALEAVLAGLKFLASRAAKAQEELEKLSNARTDGLTASVGKSSEKFKELSSDIQRAMKLAEIAAKLKDTIETGGDTLASLRLKKERQEALAGAPDSAAREAVNAEYDRRKALMELEQKEAALARERDAQDERSSALAQRRKAAEENLSAILGDQAKIKAEIAKWEAARKDEAARRETLGSGNDDRSRWLDRQINALGLGGGMSGESYANFDKRTTAQIEKLKKSLEGLSKDAASAQKALDDVAVDEKAAEVERARVEQAELALAAERELADAKNKATDAARAQKDAEAAAAEAEDRRAEALREVEAKERELAALQKRNADDESKRQADLLRKRLDAAREIAGLTTEGNMARRKAAKDAENEAEREAKKAARLEDAESRGIRLSRGNKEWLEARREIERAQKEAAAAAVKMKAAEEARQEEVAANTAKCADELRQLKDKLAALATVQ